MLTWYHSTPTTTTKTTATNFIKSTTIRELLWKGECSLDEKDGRVFDDPDDDADGKRARTNKLNLLKQLAEKGEKFYYALGWMVCVDESTKDLKYAVSCCIVVA